MAATEVPDFWTDLRSIQEPFQHLTAFPPASTTQCHASNLLLLKNGDLLCAWFGGSQEGKSDISIYLSRLPKGSKEWVSPEKLTYDDTRSEQNPVLFESPSGDVWLLHTSQNAGDQDSSIVKKRLSTDGAQTWGRSEVFISEPGTFIRQPIVVLPSGTWVLPVFKCRTEPGTRWVGNDDISCVRSSTDAGATWTETEVPNSYGCVHMQIQPLKQGRGYLALFRSRWADNIYLSTSSNGANWVTPTPTSLPNPNSGICFSVLPSTGRIFAIYNHSSRANAVSRREGLYDDIAESGDQRKNQVSKHGDKEAFWGAPRAPLCIAWSDNEGKTWEHKVLGDGDGYCLTNNSEQRLNRELSYPSMVLEEDGTVNLAFTFWRLRIKYMRFKVDEICK